MNMFSRNHWTIACALLALWRSSLPAADLLVEAENLVTGDLQNRRITLTLTAPQPRVHQGALISREPVTRFTDTYGLTTFSNTIWGRYRLDIAGNPSSSFELFVPDTNGIVSAASLIGRPILADYLAALRAAGTNDFVEFQDLDPVFFDVINGMVTLRAAPSPLTISGLIVNPPVAEIGSIVQLTSLSWSISGSAPTAQFLNQGIGYIAPNFRQFTDSSEYSTNRTYTLTITNATRSTSASATVYFRPKTYYGASSSASMDDEQLISLSSDFATSRVQSRTISPSAQHIYFAWPTSFGAPLFQVNGLLNTAWTKTTRDHTNASGYTSSYDIYRSDNLLTGTYIISVQ